MRQVYAELDDSLFDGDLLNRFHPCNLPFGPRYARSKSLPAILSNHKFRTKACLSTNKKWAEMAHL
jgi:hypothetical protein